VDGNAIEHGTEVVIVRYEHGIAYVELGAALWRKVVPEGQVSLVWNFQRAEPGWF